MSVSNTLKHLSVCVSLCALFTLMAIPLCAQEKGDEPISVLVLGSISRMAIGAYMADDTVVEKMGEENINVVYMPYDDVTWDILKQFNVIVLTMEPTIDPTNTTLMEGYENYKKVEPLFYAFLEQGGGIFVFVDSESFSHRVDKIVSEFLEPLGARLSYQLLDEDKEDCHFFDDWFHACATDNISKNHPATKNLSTFWYFGKGTFPLVVDDNWTVLAKSGNTTKAEEIKTDYVQNTDPIAGPGTPIIAARQWKGNAGRMIIYSGLASFHIQAGYHPRWYGWCLDNGGGLEFFRDSFRWLAEPSSTSGVMGGYSGTQDELFEPIDILKRATPFKDVPPEKQPDKGVIFKGISGPRLTGSVTVTDFAKVAREEGFDFIIFLEPNPTKEEWEKLVADCKQASSETFLAIPGTEFDYEVGNSGFAFSLTSWPPLHYATDHLMLVMGANGGYGNGHKNIVPPNLMGFFNLYEVYAYDKDLNLIASGRDMFDTLNKYDWFNLPFANYRIEDPEKLRDFTGYCQYVLAGSLDDVEVALSPRVRNTFLSNGPLVKSFWIEGAGVNDDYFEGRSYTWTSDEDALKIHLDIASENPIDEVNLLQDGEIVRSFKPSDGGVKSDGGFTFSASVEKYSDQSNHVFWLVVKDNKGKEAISKLLRTRGTLFWAHGGGDRANTYDGLYVDHPKGQFYWLGHQTTMLGNPSFDLSRGHMAYYNPYPARPGVDNAPVCAYETNVPIGGLGGFQPAYPQIYTTDGVLPHNPIARRYGIEPAGGDVHIIDEDCFSYYIDKDAPESNTSYVKELKERGKYTGDYTKFWTNINQKHLEFLGNDYFDEHNTYINYRWKPYGVIAIIIEKELSFHKDVQLAARDDGLEVEMTVAIGKDWSRDVLSGYSFVDPAGSVIHMTNQDFRNSSRLMKEGQLGRGGYVGLWQDPWGNFGISSLDDNEYDFVIYNDPAISIGYEWPNRVIPAGTVLKSSNITYLTHGTEAPDGKFQETFFKQFGFAGKPKWEMKLTQGYKVSERYETITRAENYGVRGSLTNGLVVDPIPLRVEKINENWESGLIVPAQNKLLRTSPWLGHESVFFVLEPTSDDPMDFYAGNLVLANKEYVKLSLLKVRDDSVKIDAHNPTNAPVRVKIWTVDMAPVLPHVETEVELAPGEAKILELTAK